MEAKALQTIVILAAISSLGATSRTPNFVVTASQQEVAEQVATAAEQYRKAIAIDWLGHELPSWYAPCQVTVRVGQIGAGGATTFSFDRGEVFGWRMNIQGSLERILDSVLPHEITHTIFACHFRRPLPRWADEGAATLIEHPSERRRQELLLKETTANGGRIPLRRLLSMQEYPEDMHEVLKLYAQGYSLAGFLVQLGGKKRYLAFIEDADHIGWSRAIEKHYGDASVESLEHRWTNWVVAGSPPLSPSNGQQLAAQSGNKESRSAAQVVVRGQSPEKSIGAALAASRGSARTNGRTIHGGVELARDAAMPAGYARQPNAIQSASPSTNLNSASDPDQYVFEDPMSIQGWTPIPRPPQIGESVSQRKPRSGWQLPVLRIAQSHSNGTLSNRLEEHFDTPDASDDSYTRGRGLHSDRSDTGQRPASSRSISHGRPSETLFSP